MTVAQFMRIAELLEAAPNDLLFAPLAQQQSSRYRRAAEIAKDIPDDKLDAWLTVGASMVPERQ